MSAQQEKKDNANYANHFTRNPNILYDSYKHITKEEKWLHSCLRRLFCEDAKPRYYSLRELSKLTDYSVGALSKMLPRLTKVGLIHAEVKKKRTKDGKETGNALYHITIVDIWELNKNFYACSPNEQVDPSDVLVHEMTQACSRNDTSLFTKNDKPVLSGEQDRAQNAPHRSTIRNTQKKYTEEDTAHVSDDNAPLTQSSLSETTSSEENEQASTNSPIATGSVKDALAESPTEQQSTKRSGSRKPRKPIISEDQRNRVDHVYEVFDILAREVTRDENYRYQRTKSDDENILKWLECSPTEGMLGRVYRKLWNTPKDERTGFDWKENMSIRAVLKQYDRVALGLRANEQGSAPINTKQVVETVANLAGYTQKTIDLALNQKQEAPMRHLGPRRNRRGA